MKDYRNLFRDFYSKKNPDFWGLPSYGVEEFDEKQIRALIDIYNRNLLVISPVEAIDEDIFSPEFLAQSGKTFRDQNALEWIVFVDSYGYYYVDTEGFVIPRYAFRIDDDTAEILFT